MQQLRFPLAQFPLMQFLAYVHLRWEFSRQLSHQNSPNFALCREQMYSILNRRKCFMTPYDHCVLPCTKRWWPANGFRSFEFYHQHSEPLLAKLWSFLSIIRQELFLETTDYGRPMKLFYIQIQNFFRQIGQINSGAFGVFSAKLSAHILIQ